MKPVSIKEAVIVEGRYDKSRLSQMLDGLIVKTDGFQIFKDKEKLEYIKMLANTRGIVILTDSDRAGFVIRNHLKGCVDPKNIKHAYIPEISGKEKRKSKEGADGLVGVEGISNDILLDALMKAGCTLNDTANANNGRGEISAANLYEDGLTGGELSLIRRQKFLKSLNLPQKMSVKSMLSTLNELFSYKDYKKHLKNLEK